MPYISIIYLTYNGISDHFPESLKMVFAQKIKDSYEIIAIDSGSSDGTLDLIKKFKIKLYQIPNQEFGHGKTRQLGVTKAKGEIVVFLSQDAVPKNQFWLANLIKNFQDQAVMGVCSRVIPRKEASLLKKIEVNNDLSGRSVKIVAQIKDLKQFKALSVKEKRKQYYFFNNVSSAIRKDFLLKNPFPFVKFGEDVEFAKMVLRKGKKIAFEPTSLVYHSHNYDLKTVYKRNFLDAKFNQKFLKHKQLPTIISLLINTLSTVFRDLIEFKKFNTPFSTKILALLYSPIIHFIEQLGRFRGARQINKK